MKKHVLYPFLFLESPRQQTLLDKLNLRHFQSGLIYRSRRSFKRLGGPKQHGIRVSHFPSLPSSTTNHCREIWRRTTWIITATKGLSGRANLDLIDSDAIGTVEQVFVIVICGNQHIYFLPFLVMNMIPLFHWGSYTELFRSNSIGRKLYRLHRVWSWHILGMPRTMNHAMNDE